MGDSGAITTSMDGVTWTVRPSGTTARFRGVSYGAGKFIVVGDAGVMWTSSDGVNWNSISSGTTVQLTAVSYAANRFVAVGAGGTVRTSPDGATWTARNAGTTQQLWSVSYGNSVFIAVGVGGVLLTSADGISWTSRDSGVTSDLFTLASGAGLVIAAGDQGALLSSSPAAGAASRIANLSVRSVAGSGDQTLIMGFVISGGGTKQMLVRGIGPTLAQFGVPGFVADPQLKLFRGGALINQNDDWGGGAALSTAYASVGAFPLPAGSKDAALFMPLSAGSYSAQVGAVTGAGVTLIEGYDADGTAATARLVNFSVRNQTGTGGDILIVGLTILGESPRKLLIRGVGPALAQFGVGGALVNPKLQLYRDAALIAENDDWAGTTAVAAAFSAVGAFSLPVNSKDSALVYTVLPGSYTVQVSGVGGTTGVALVEVYEVP